MPCVSKLQGFTSLTFQIILTRGTRALTHVVQQCHQSKIQAALPNTSINKFHWCDITGQFLQLPKFVHIIRVIKTHLKLLLLEDNLSLTVTIAPSACVVFKKQP